MFFNLLIVFILITSYTSVVLILNRLVPEIYITIKNRNLQLKTIIILFWPLWFVFISLFLVFLIIEDFLKDKKLC